ncbi:MAG: SusD/RagB family nutrient-binding outer membrane lipoprotein [Bacteroidota bacterium]
MEKISNNTIVFLFSLLFIVSCEDLADTNLDPGRPGGENVNLVAVTPIMQTQSHRNFLATAGRMAGIFTQQFRGLEAQQLAFTQYTLDEGTLADFWEAGLYTGSMRDCIDMIERADKLGNVPHTRGLARIYLATNLGFATNFWGDLPYTEAFKGADNLQPSYDSQEEIYASIQQLLDEAISDFGQTDPQGVLGDLVGADWVAVAHALKARYYLQLSKRDQNAANKVLAELELAFEGNGSAPIFDFENTPNGGNPLALFGISRPNTLAIAPFFDDLMEDDPRRGSYMVPSSDGSSQLYFENGNTDLFWAQFGSPSPLISYAEVKFMEAEALQRTGSDARPALEAAITANMEFIDIGATEIDAYLNTLTDVDLETIIIEKYKAMYGSNPVETWNDFRRTGFPELAPNPEGSNGSNPSGVIPRRVLYPGSERLANTEAYEAAIAAQGGHLLDVDLWAFKD